ncbi:MAG: 16S rRNA (guanine(966)-N(2))-methyltransferase RsmD [Verrucomicrobiota bacterium]|nr:16S rRNA (guanine(966)-N(2))-methyltransferase RsmD [Verrucomicrobiota bacterium]
MRIIAGALKGRTLKQPKGSVTRPTQGMLRGAVFNICQNEVEGARFLDLFAGSGAMGLEALSRGASLAVFVEQNRQALACIRDNIAAFGVESRAEVMPMPVERALKVLAGRQFDLIYIDPPYDLSVDLAALSSFVAPQGTVFLEERADPKRQETLIPGLQKQQTRRFGSTALTLFSV